MDLKKKRYLIDHGLILICRVIHLSIPLFMFLHCLQLNYHGQINILYVSFQKINHLFNQMYYFFASSIYNSIFLQNSEHLLCFLLLNLLVLPHFKVSPHFHLFLLLLDSKFNFIFHLIINHLHLLLHFMIDLQINTNYLQFLCSIDLNSVKILFSFFEDDILLECLKQTT